MRKTLLSLALAFTLLGGSADAGQGGFQLSSPGIADGGTMPDAQIFNGFGCSGGNRSPELVLSDLPAGTRSLAVTIYDPDAPTGSGWWHWVVFNLPPDLTRLPEGAGDPAAALLPKGAMQGRNDFGQPAFGGACPPPGDPAHRYIITAWALDTEKLPLDSTASGAMVGFFLNQHAIAKATLTALYGR